MRVSERGSVFSLRGAVFVPESRSSITSCCASAALLSAVGLSQTKCEALPSLSDRCLHDCGNRSLQLNKDCIKTMAIKQLLVFCLLDVGAVLFLSLCFKL